MRPYHHHPQAGACRPFTELEVHAIRAACAQPGRQRVSILVELMFAGCRCGEARRLRVCDVVELDERQWQDADRVRGDKLEVRRLVRLWTGEKGDKGTLILTATCRARIKKALCEMIMVDPLGPIVCSREGKRRPLSYERARSSIKEILAECGITDGQVSTHSFRKTWVKWLLNGKWSTLSIRDAGRWRHVASVEAYAKSDPNDLARLLEETEQAREATKQEGSFDDHMAGSMAQDDGRAGRREREQDPTGGGSNDEPARAPSEGA